jgi:type VI secretion system secreted protein Hcp
MEYMILEITGIDGETKLEGFTKETSDSGNVGIEILSYSWNVSNPVQASPSNVGRTTGRPNFGELVLTKRLDSTTPIICDDCASAKNLGDVVFSLVRQDEAAGENLCYMKYELSNTLISSVSVGGSGEIPIETISLNYSAINWIYVEQKEDMGAEAGGEGGGATAARGWDLALNKEADAAGGGGD